MGVAARHRSLEAQRAARERQYFEALGEETRRNRAANEELAEDEAVHPRHALMAYGDADDDDDDEPLPAKQRVHQSEWQEDPLEEEASAIRSAFGVRAAVVTEVIEWSVPILIMAAKHAGTSVAEARRYVDFYLLWKHMVTKLWSPPSERGLDVFIRMQCKTQIATVARVESSPEFRAVRKLLDKARKGTHEYRDSHAKAERRARSEWSPERKLAEAAKSKDRMAKMRARKAAALAAQSGDSER